MAVTLKTIAEKAGVSVMAVSAALNNTTRTRISAEKREYICKIASELGYRPNVLAQRLSGGTSHLIGVVVDSYLSSSSAMMLRGIEEEARKRGYRILVAEQHESISGLREIFGIFEQYGVDGAICLSHDYISAEEEVRKLLCKAKNTVLWEALPGADIPYVAIDCTGAFRKLIGGWKAAGRIRPGIVQNTDFNRQMIYRTECFVRVCREFGLTPEVIKVNAAHDDSDIFRFMETTLRSAIIPRKLDCILTENDLWACSFMGAAAQHNLKVPDDIAVAGWDNEFFCCGLTPKLASISINAAEIGHRLVELFIKLVNKENTAPVVVPSEFYCRESCGFTIG